jgi:hypothetical protein
MGNPFEGVVENSEMPYQSVIAIKIERGSHFFSDLFYGNPLTLKLMILIFKKVHRISR